MDAVEWSTVNLVDSTTPHCTPLMGEQAREETASVTEVGFDSS